MSFGNSDTTTTSKVELPRETKELLKLGMPYAKQFAANPPSLPSSPMTAAFDPAQMAGQQAAVGAAPVQGQLAGDAAGATNFLLNKALFPNTNPALQQTIDAAVRPIQENLTSSTLPAIRSEAALKGQYGGSRQGVAEGIASRAASQAIGDTGAKVATEGYKSGLDAMYRALGLAPQTSDMQLSPAVTLSGVGDVRQGQQQRLIDEGVYRSMYGQQLPLMMAQELAALAQGIPGGGGSVTAPAAQGNPLTGAIGGGTLGAALFPAAAGPAGLAGAGIGALLSML